MSELQTTGTIKNFSRPCYYAHPIPAVDTGDLIIAVGLGETDDDGDVVTLTIAAGPTSFEINLSAEDAKAIADDLNACAGVDAEDGAA